MNEIEIYNNWYDVLVEELRDLIVETEFTSRWALIEGYHALGMRILQENDNFERAKIYKENIAQRIALSIGKSERTVNYAIKFAQMYPDLNMLPEGKNISYHHIINKYLTNGEKSSKIISKKDLMEQIEAIKELLEHEYLEAHQYEVENNLRSGDIDCGKCKYIRYLQDRIEKITQEV